MGLGDGAVAALDPDSLGAGGAGVEWIDRVWVRGVRLRQRADPGVQDGDHRNGEQGADDAGEHEPSGHWEDHCQGVQQDRAA